MKYSISRAQKLKIVRLALKARQRAEKKPWEAICVYDFTEALGFELRFLDVPSMEAMYFDHQPPTIIVSSLRPDGRRRFNCAHELGHHYLMHGTKADEYIAGDFKSQEKEEFMADFFAANLLMPKTAVDTAISNRGYDIKKLIPLQVYSVSCWLGVGYTTVINHMCYTLGTIDRSQSHYLQKVTPKQIKSDLISNHDGNILVADSHWQSRPIDIEEGDLICLPNDIVIEGDSIAHFTENDKGKFIIGNKPGRGRIIIKNSNWSSFVRVNRKEFVGRSIFRHREEIDDDC